MQQMIRLVCLTLISMCLNFIEAAIDLEENIQDFILEVRKINIPGYPHAFNPSIVRWQDKYLMSFRSLPDGAEISPISSSCASEIGFIWLDENFFPCSGPYGLCPLKCHDTQFPIISEDARLIVIGEQLFIVYSGVSSNIISDEFFRVYVAEIKWNGECFVTISNECLNKFEGAKKNRREKNWVPFNYNDTLLLSYSLAPHKVFRPRLDCSKTCETFCSTCPSVVWEWGELRGGTPALLVDDAFYLAFFHSQRYLSSIHSSNECIPHYFIGAYTFSKEPPFEIKRISPEPIVGKNFYNGDKYKPYWHPVSVVFPCGFVHDDDYIWLTYGRQDHEIWVTKLDKPALLKTLINVSTLSTD